MTDADDDEFEGLSPAKDWYRAKWERRPALVHPDGGAMTLYVGQKYDPAHFNLVADAWDHDHCEVCYATISNKSCDNAIQDAYTDGRAWICPSCYERMIANSPLE
ncbi:MAG: hypothetical protein GC159_18440 [Phycisphaera sp.]|nr:hypothetical protein [Phycisphaera sp.]